jgi:two-component system CAI-1 autoinducer sensor kinase/phosphatase CqsS
LLNAYKIALEHNLVTTTIDNKHLKILDALVPNIRTESTQAIEFLDLLHPYDKKLLSSSEDIAQLSIKACLNHLLEQHAFKNEQERALVTVECKEDFQFKCAPIFIDNLLSNLLDNALRCIEKAAKGTLSIWTTNSKNYNEIHFKDTGSGIAPNNMLRVFHRFFTQRNGITLPGLGFCRLAILQADGDVTCNSALGEYTEFVITFPKIK